MSPKHQRFSDHEGSSSRKTPAAFALLAALALALVGLSVPTVAFADIMPMDAVTPAVPAGVGTSAPAILYTPVDDPATGGLAADGPATGPSTNDATSNDATSNDATSTDATSNDAATTDSATTDSSSAGGSADEAPVPADASEPPATEPPATEPPATQPPATAAPSTEAPATDTPSSETPAPQGVDAGALSPDQPAAPKPESVPPAYPAETPPGADSSATDGVPAVPPPDRVPGASPSDTETAAKPDTGAVYPGDGDVIEKSLTLTDPGQDAARRAHAGGILPPGLELDPAKAAAAQPGSSPTDATTSDGMKTDAFKTGSTEVVPSGDAPVAVKRPADASKSDATKSDAIKSESRNGVDRSIVPRPSFNPGRLAHTGFEAGWLVWLGAGLALLGTLFAVLAVRRRRSDEAEDAESD